MKKFTSIALAVLLVAVMMVPMAFAVEEKEVAVSAPAALPWWMMPVKDMSSKRELVTTWYVPEESSVAPDFVYVKPEGKTVVNTGSGYVPEGDIQNYGLEGPTTWILGDTNAAVWKADVDFSKCKQIAKIGETPVPEDKVAFSKGSTIIEVASDYMNSLEAGKQYTITIEFTDGTATGIFEVVEAAEGAAAGTAAGATGTTGGAAAGGAAAGGDVSGAAAGGAAAGGSAAGGAGAGAAATGSTPKTGDNSYTILWAAISLVTLGAIGVVALPLVKKVKA